ncbi:hypothetical protein IFM12275_28880 [Nocardia sputorum]|nr:hypothetical protein IFM12275_28880 [Nocardia sputorum]
MSARVREHAAELGVRVSVAIADGGGHLLVLDRMDGAPPLSARVAPAKATSVALFHRDGSELARLQQAWPALFAQMDQVAGTPVIAGAGARLIRRDDAVIGALAVSGSLPEHDDQCAEAGITWLVRRGRFRRQSDGDRADLDPISAGERRASKSWTAGAAAPGAQLVEAVPGQREEDGAQPGDYSHIQ